MKNEKMYELRNLIIECKGISHKALETERKLQDHNSTLAIEQSHRDNLKYWNKVDQLLDDVQRLIFEMF